MATPEPELSQITPNVVTAGSPEFELEVQGVGFVSNSVVRVNGGSVPTVFVNPRVLKAKIPAALVKSASRSGSVSMVRMSASRSFWPAKALVLPGFFVCWPG